jgi:hypothetical protein
MDFIQFISVETTVSKLFTGYLSNESTRIV